MLGKWRFQPVSTLLLPRNVLLSAGRPFPRTLAKDDGESLAEALDGLPISDVAPRRAGRWIDGTLRAATAQEWPHRVRTGDFAKRPVES